MHKKLWTKSETIIHKYGNEKQDFHIWVSADVKIWYWVVVSNSNLSFTLDIEYENADVECYFLLPAIKNQTTTLNIVTNFKSSNAKVDINVIALSCDQACITLNGNLHIHPWVKNVNARLYEEALLISDAKYVSMIPWLRVDSPDVIASHWAKIYRISPERLFYMQSRGLSEQKAMNMIIHSYSQWISDKLNLNEKEKSDFYSMIA